MKRSYDPWSNPELVRPGAPIGRAWRSGRRKVLVFLVLSAVAYAAYSAIGGEHGFLRLRALHADEVRLEREIAASEDRVRALQGDLKEIDRTIEERARTTFEMATPREMIYEVVEDSAVARPAAGGESEIDGPGEGAAPSEGEASPGPSERREGHP
ncbi:MAG: septum formation initiator family protein [Candidatus Eisenbacteria bacterium]|nr:septum formation initiator family protein [Candidatus Eisenbacteria bacterium]